MISPIDVATEGYLNSPLSVSASGYLIIATIIINPDTTGAGGGDSRQIKAKNINLIHQQLEEDEIIISLVVVMIEQDLI